MVVRQVRRCGFVPRKARAPLGNVGSLIDWPAQGGDWLNSGLPPSPDWPGLEGQGHADRLLLMLCDLSLLAKVEPAAAAAGGSNRTISLRDGK